MTSSDFETYLSALRDHGFHEVDSRFDEAFFGTWVIVFDTSRALWEGKEQWLTVQRNAFFAAGPTSG